MDASNKKVLPLIIRQTFCKIQAIALNAEMIKFCKCIKHESLIDVYGTVQVSPKQKILRAHPEHLQNIEIVVKQCFIVSGIETNELPFNLQHASLPETSSHSNTDSNNEQKSEVNSQNSQKQRKVVNIGQKQRLDHRWFDLRTPANYAIFCIQSGVCRFFREFLQSQKFIEIHTPKILSAASEGGAEVFKLQPKSAFWNGEETFLAQSPQLHKQMAICSDFHRVFEIGSVFRAEDSHTHRHLCEFIGLDLEMEIIEHYHEALQLIGQLFVYVFQHIEQHYKYELEAIRKQYAFTPLRYNPKKLLILTYQEAKAMTQKYYEELVDTKQFEQCEDLLCKPAIVNEFRQLLKEHKMEEIKLLLGKASKDFTTTEEKLLGKLISSSEKYGFTEFYCVDKFPMKARPFYTMMDPFNEEVSNSYDFFLRGEEITSGAQRIHNAKLLMEQARKHKIPLSTIQAYIDSFKLGTSPHAGCGIGLERVVMLYLGLDNVRKASMFPRDPLRCTP